MKFTVFSKPNCPACDQAKSLLQSTGAEFEVIMLDVGQPKQEDQQYITRDELLNMIPTARMMPQIALQKDNGTQYVGSLPELRALLPQMQNAA